MERVLLLHPGNLDDSAMIPQWRNRQLSNSNHFILTMSTMMPAAPLLLCLTLMILGVILTILEVAPPMRGAPSVASPLLPRLSQRHLRRVFFFFFAILNPLNSSPPLARRASSPPPRPKPQTVPLEFPAQKASHSSAPCLFVFIWGSGGTQQCPI